MVLEYLKFSLPQLNLSYSFAPVYTQPLLIRYFDFPQGRLSQVPDEEYLYKLYPIKSYECNLQKGMVLEKVTDGHLLMERGYYIIEGKCRNELNIIDDEIRKLFTQEYI
jgi:hypothetical protein